MIRQVNCLALLLAGLLCTSPIRGEELSLATFHVDVSPPVGSPLAYDPTVGVSDPLSCKGIILRPEGESAIVLCAIDWLGVANASQDLFREHLARAAETTPDRVVVHSIHQHDAPRCDLTAAKVLQQVGHAAQHFDTRFIEDCAVRVAAAAREASSEMTGISSVAVVKARVRGVASNRRMLGPDGTVHTTRYTACRDPKIRDLPEGVIDPWMRVVEFRSGSGPVARMSFYATHPQSYYRTGMANPDFPGLARNAQEKETGVFWLHFNGAGGNIGAGKYNDGSRENRQVLADKIQAAMQAATQELADAEERESPTADWRSVPVTLPAGPHLVKESLSKSLQDDSLTPPVRLNTAKKLAYLERLESEKQIRISRLKLGNSYVLWMPGELFVEYQLAGQAMRPDTNVLMAAYGEYGTGYIGTKAAYPQGGYEVSERASNVAPESEEVLINAMRELLDATNRTVVASDFTDRSGLLPKSK